MKKKLFYKHTKSFFILTIFFISFVSIFSINLVSGYENKEKLEFKNLKKRLVLDGFTEKNIEKIFANPKVFFDVTGVSDFFIYSEAKLDYNQFLSKKSLEKAFEYIKKHKVDFKKVEVKYGVDKTIITAILLVETRLGTYLGKRSVINTLSTMAVLSEKKQREKLWDSIKDSKKIERKEFEKKANKKSNWGYTELKALLKYAAREHINPAKIKGSYAGAIGIPQFMPSNCLALAKDGNKDGNITLFNHTDAIYSVANYLKHFGWEPSITRQKQHKILYKYNHSNYYVDTLLKISDSLNK
ncbi:MAG: protein MltB [Desulfobacteraceae bacterium 4572_130]|nr:MAG: protein MltB [Desulfobacteraceae bacterium 4572_130]